MSSKTSVTPKKTAGKAVKAKAAIKAANPSHAAQVKQTSRMSPALRQYAKQFMMPMDLDGESLLVSPATGSHQLCVRHLHRVLDVDSATLPNGFTAIMRPDLTDPGFISASGVTVVPPAVGILSLEGRIVGLNGGASDADTAQKFVANGPVETPTMLQLQSIADSAALSHAGFNLTPSPATNASFTVYFQDTATFRVWTKIAAGAWVISFSRSGGITSTQSVQVLIPANSNAIAFDFSAGPVSTPPSVNLQMTFDNAQVTSAAAASIAPAFPKFILDLGITTGRVISMSLLASNTSADVARGGNVNAARVPSTHGVFSNIPSNIALLPDNRRYQGPASEGAYVWWMPSQIDEFEPNSVIEIVPSLREADFVIVNVTGWAPGAGLGSSTFRLQFDWLVEFYTPNQLFEKIQTPPLVDDFELLYHQLLTVHAATCNPGHLDLLKEALRKGMSAVSHVHGIYSDNKVLFDTLARTLAAALL